jgi:Bacterial SH3 domain
MILRRTLTGLALCVMALALFMGCVETGPPPPPPMVVTPPPPPSPPLYFVTVSGLALREGPTTASPQIGTLEFNDAVELLDTSSGWGRVVDVRRDLTGWASMRYLQPMPADRARTVPRKRPAPAPKETPKETPKPAESPKAM